MVEPRAVPYRMTAKQKSVPTRVRVTFHLINQINEGVLKVNYTSHGSTHL